MTCGRGLAANATLPAKLGELTLAVAAILEAHIPSLDLTDDRSRREREVYQRLVEQHRGAAGQLAVLGRQMAESRDLPMGRHDAAAMAAPAVIGTFERFVQVEQELIAMLRQRLEEDQGMLVTMKAGR